MTAIIFIIVLSVIVFVHELGHFVMAKRAKMKVEEFGFGFPPRIFGKKVGDTTYSINAIPFGGFVKIVGEDESEARTPGTFGAGSFFQKISVVVAGVAMNFLFAVVLLIIVNFIGSEAKILITQIAPDSPAQQAGLRVGDEVVGFESVEAVQTYIKEHVGTTMTLSLKRGDIKLIPRTNPPPGEGATGIALAQTDAIDYTWYESIWHGIQDAFVGFWTIIAGFGILIKNVATTGKSGGDLAGPIGIAVITGQAARLGFAYLLQFVAFISLNLAVINIIPFPALDGGRLLFIIIEKLKGSPLSKRVESTANTVGFALLPLLMFYITAKDVLKFF